MPVKIEDEVGTLDVGSIRKRVELAALLQDKEPIGRWHEREIHRMLEAELWE